jgi:hypothetical protein
MTSFAPAAALPRVVPLDPTKHVNYTPGMLLGVNDFTQEFGYHQARARRLARELGGAGTLWGLGVGFSEGVDDVQVVVQPGSAVSPCGELICVSPAQCASLNTWLDEHASDVVARAGALPGALRLYLVACYRECLTDDVPIPGEPCRSTAELMAASRVKDDFRLELRFDPPDDVADVALADYLAWLRQIPIVAGPGTPPADFEAALHEVIATASHRSPPASPPDGPPLIAGSPPDVLAIPGADVAGYVAVALRVWVTDGLPKLQLCDDGSCGCGCGCSGSTGTREEACDDAVLLAALDLRLEAPPTGGVRLAPNGWSVDDSARPFLLSTRLLQELGLAALGVASGPPVPVLPFGAAAPAAPVAAVAAPAIAGGRVLDDGSVAFAYGGLQAEKTGANEFRLFGFDGIGSTERAVVTGSPIVAPGAGYTFEVVDTGAPPGPEVFVRVRRLDGKTSPANTATSAFNVHIVDFGGAE